MHTKRWGFVGAAALLVLSIAGCPGSGDAGPAYPPDWESELVELRDCRQSIEHELEYVRMFADAESVEHYERCTEPGAGCTEPFDVGATFVKPQYLDEDCTELLRISASVREEPGEAVWRWQEVTAEGEVVLDDDTPESCVSCHSTCDGSYDLRCAMDP